MQSRSAIRIVLACFILALIFRLGILFGSGLYRKIDRTEMASVAISWARTGQIANPYMTMPTGPTAHVPPGYPLLIGFVYRMFGGGRSGETVKQVLACMVSAARAPLLVVLALSLGLGDSTALAAGLISAVYVAAADTELRGDWEGPLAANLLMLLILWGFRMTQRRVPNWRWGILYGLAWGAALLVSPALAPVAGGLAILGLCTFGARRILSVLVCFYLGIVLATLPWVARNYATFGTFIWVRGNLGLELSVSNGPGAQWSNPQNQARIFSMHPSRYPPATLKLLQQGEAAFNADRQREAISWIRAHPREFTALTVSRTFHFWFPPGRNPIHRLALALLTVAAYSGMAVLWKQESPAMPWVAVTWITYPLVYYVIQWSSRYRQPIDWSLILCAAVACMEFSKAWIRRRTHLRDSESAIYRGITYS
jgi:4-amino-4-deoxy-L-arabinose transferase-like glycosyltransferase